MPEGTEGNGAHWDALFERTDVSSYYERPLGPELEEVVHHLPKRAKVLDLGCGMGRASIALAERGCRITAVDSSIVAIERLRAEAGRRNLRMDIWNMDVRDLKLEGSYDLIIAHGIFQFLSREEWTELLGSVRGHTGPGGSNLVAVFTDKIPLPLETTKMVRGLFREGELFELYRGWDLLHRESFVKEEMGEDGTVGRYPIERLIARKSYI